MQWDLFCRVVDNYGDIGVCWRLAADFANRGDKVRLWANDASALAWMAPQGARRVEVRAWPADDDTDIEPNEAVIEAFGCQLPTGFVTRMAARERPPTWINLEYLSAERYVELNHGLLSPQASGPGQGLKKWFFYPGFTAVTGGLPREPDLFQRQTTFDAEEWLNAQSLSTLAGERRVSLFCYANPALPGLFDALSEAPTLLLVTAGIATEQVRSLLGTSASHRALRVRYLPPLTQRDYDHLLWSCDLNLVRGEDSFVRAQWAAKPFLWQIYPQDDAAHGAKLAAFNQRFLSAAAPDLRAALGRATRIWNDLCADGKEPERNQVPPPALWEAWHAHCRAWRSHLAAQPDLASSLRAFVQKRR